MEAEKSLLETYRERFRVYPEVDGEPERLDAVYRLRYQVYCVENAFEEPAEFPDGRERDPFDGQAIHSLLVHRQSDAAAGTVRMVLPALDAGGILPLDTVCDDASLRDERLLPRTATAEISRFAISKQFRRRRRPRWSTESWTAQTANHDVAFGADLHRRLIPHLCLGLIEALVVNSARHGLTHWCAAMEPSLLRMLRTLGIHFRHLGPLVEHHGLRQPCYTEVDSMLHRVYRERFDIWNLITDHGAHWPRSSTGPGDDGSAIERRAL